MSVQRKLTNQPSAFRSSRCLQTNLDFVLSSVFVIESLLRRDGVGVATTDDWIAG